MEKTNNQLIELLNKRNSNYSDPYQAMFQYNSLVQLSSGIYTEEERFIYELLQNADDSALNSKLKVRIDINTKNISFSHNGEPFSEVDVKSICSVGDGGKSKDENKTGYKGIGFKSVFTHSKNVAIKTGNYLFKFSESEWKNYWNNNSWGSIDEWIKERNSDSKPTDTKMPWQIIPIPYSNNQLHSEFNAIADYNVSTILFDVNTESIKKRVLQLLSDSQILLFLRSNEVVLEVFVSGKLELSIKKLFSNDSIILYNNEVQKSEWIVTHKKLDILKEVIEDIAKDDKTPPKLKGATNCVVSFAIKKDKNKLVALDDALIFTYLPTSVSPGFPFIVNSNFITDAGRQQLQKESKWNLWIFEQLAPAYLNWIAELANTKKLDKSFLAIIPEFIHYGELGEKFNEGYSKAIDKIAFLPNKNNKLLKVKEAIYDSTKLTDIISSDVLIKYLNSKYNKKYTTSALLPEYTYAAKLKTLGVQFFNLDELDEFFRSEIFQENHKLDDNFKLISFLFDYVSRLKSTDSKYEWEEKLKNTPFIFDKDEKLCTPSEIYFPSIQSSVQFKDNLHFVNKIIFDQISTQQSIKDWLIKLGLAELTDNDFITKTIIGDDEFITEDNAIEVGRYLFEAHKKGRLKDNHYEKLANINLLTQEGSLLKAKDCFLSNSYEPDLKLEVVYENDFYTSDSYYSKNDLKSEWKSFFLKIRVKNDFEWGDQTIVFDSNGKWKSRLDVDFVTKIHEESKRYSWVSYEGWTTDKKGYGFWPHKLIYKSFSFIEHTENIQFSKLFFSKVFREYEPADLELNNEVYVDGSTGFLGRSLSSYQLKAQGCETNYNNWIFENLAIFPSVEGYVEKANKIFINSPENITIAGNYLPIIDVDVEISENWLDIIPFQRYLKLEDYITILSNISYNREAVNENKERILLIYKILANNYQNKLNEITALSRYNQFLSINNKFLNAKELKFVAQKGFESDDLIFCDYNEITPEFLNLFEAFGVTVISEFIPEISNPKLNTNVKNRIQEILPYILLLDEKRKDINYSNKYKKLNDLLSNFNFYEAQEIVLSYMCNGEKEQGASVRSYIENNNLYFKGDFRNPTTLYAIVPEIASYLEIEYLKDEFKLFYELNTQQIEEFILEEGINSKYLKRAEILDLRKLNEDEEEIKQSSIEIDNSSEKSRISVSDDAKKIIFDVLIANGFIVPENMIIPYTVVTGITNPNGLPVKLVVKSGKAGKLYFNPSEWLALSEENTQLFVVTRGNNVRNVTINDLIHNNDLFFMRFNSDAFAVNTNLKVFAEFFHYLKYTHFIFDTPESTTDYLQEFGLNERNKSAMDITADDKKLLL